MHLPINEKDLDTIISALTLGGDTRLYFLLKNFSEERKIKINQSLDFSEDPNVKVFSESDDYQCKHGECDI
tara:strand:+ start:400 stop:612 length:213 start_codon:yes stop_codon:yes gene_type:complete